MHNDVRLAAQGLTIAHTTDLSEDDRSAFIHAVALARQSRSRLVTVHANDDEATRDRMPRAVDLLLRWGSLPEVAREGDEQQLGMQHERVVDSRCDDPVDSILGVIRRSGAQLLIGATSGREGIARVMMGSVAEALALHFAGPALLLPQGCRPFVSDDTGQVRLERILVAAGDSTAANLGAARAAWMADVAGAKGVEVELLHIDEGGGAPPSVHEPQREGLHVHVQLQQGAVEAALLARAEQWKADLIVMATRGHDSLRDVLLGSHTERVLRRAPCPVLLVPIH